MIATTIRAAIRIVVASVAIGLAYWSFTSNAEFWRLTFAHDKSACNFYVAVSIMAGALKYGLAIYSEVFQIKLRHEKGLLLLFVAALSWDLLSGFGYSSLTRSNIDRDAADTSARRGSIVKQITEAETARDRVAYARVTGRIDAEAIPLRAGASCAERPAVNSDRCKRLAPLEIELADARARDTAELQLGQLREQLAALPVDREADPQAAAVAGALNAILNPLGVSIPDAAAKRLLSVLLVLLIEIGPATCFRAAFAVRALPLIPEPPPVRPTPKTPAPAAQAPPPSPRRRPGTTGADLLDTLRRAELGQACPSWLTVAPDGWLYFAQQAAADAAGVSKPTIGRRLKALESEGLARLQVTNSGTAIKLLYPANSVGNGRPLPRLVTHA